MTLQEVFASVGLAVAMGSCLDGAAGMPSPTWYVWPDSLSFLVEYVSESGMDSLVVARYEERKALVLTGRDDGYRVWHDSVVKDNFAAGREPVAEPLALEDTLHYYVELGSRGEISHLQPGCDPALSACREAPASKLRLELRRLIPRLPVWSPPRGYAWADTLTFDDRPRPRGVWGSVVTTYRVAGDTLITGGAFWVIAWRAVRRAFSVPDGAGGVGPPPAVEERGIFLIDKERRVPVFATWAGGSAAPTFQRVMGLTGTGFRGRAYLAGSLVEQSLSPFKEPS